MISGSSAEKGDVLILVGTKKGAFILNSNKARKNWTMAGGLRDQLPMCYSIATQFFCHDFSGFVTMTSQQTLEKPLSRRSVTPGLQEYINHFAILVYCAP